MLITLRRGSRYRGAQHRIPAGRDNDPGSWCMVLDGGIDRGLIKDAIPEEVIDDAVDLRQQLWHLCRVLRMAFRHRGGANLTLGIHPNVQFLPAFGFLLTVLLGMPFTLTADL